VSVSEVNGRLTIRSPAINSTRLQSVVQKGAKKVVVNLNGIPRLIARDLDAGAHLDSARS